MSFFCFRISSRIAISCLLSQLWSVTVAHIFLVFDNLGSFWEVLVRYFVECLNLGCSDTFLMVTLGLWVGEEDHRGEVPFSSRPISGSDSQLIMFTLFIWPRLCLPDFSPVRCPPLPTSPPYSALWKEITKCSPHSRWEEEGGSKLHLLVQGYHI